MNWNYKFVLYTALALLFAVVTISYISDLMFYKGSIGSLCFTSVCVKNFSTYFPGAISIFTEGIALIALFAVIFGSRIALDNYLVSVKSSALSGHINHLRLFKDYIETESSKIGITNTAKIDTFLWYRTMFPDSKSGNVNVSDSYVTLVKRLRSEIDLSINSLSAPNLTKNYSFTHGDHQRRIIESLAEIGIFLSRKAPKDFFETESNAFRLVDSVNLTFSTVDTGDPNMCSLNINRSYL